MLKDKKTNQIDNGYLLLKKVLCNNKGIHFTDNERIDNDNTLINEKMATVKR
jgi:hypothetical protein